MKHVQGMSKNGVTDASPVKPNESKSLILAQLLKLERRIESEYDSASTVLETPGVAEILRFLAELDTLATRHDFSPREIIMMLEPNYFETADEQQLEQPAANSTK